MTVDVVWVANGLGALDDLIRSFGQLPSWRMRLVRPLKEAVSRVHHIDKLSLPLIST